LSFAGKVDNRFFTELSRRPFDAGRPDANVAGENYDGRGGIRRIEFTELRVQVTEYLQFHRRV
jgi:hypothetical protein